MFPATNQTTVSNSLLAEVATSGIFPDPALFVYGVLGTLVAGFLLVGYVICGRSAGPTRRLRTHQDEVIAYNAARASEPPAALVADLGSLLDSLEIRETPVDSTVLEPVWEEQLQATGYIE